MMSSPRPASARLVALLFALLAVSFLGLVDAKKEEPRITKTTFDHIPSQLFYFPDTDIVLFQDREAGNIYRSTDAGESWDKVGDIPEGDAWDLWFHPFDGKVAYVLGPSETHWVTKDQGKTWADFEIDGTPTLFRPPFGFHAGDSNKVLLHGQVCQEWQCTETTYLTRDGFETIQKLREDTRGCMFARSSELFTTGHSGLDQDRIFCVVKGRYSPWPKDNRLVYTDNDFVEEIEPLMEAGRTVPGVLNMVAVKRFIVAAVKAEGTDELALYVTKDAETWHRAVFPSDHRLEEEAYTILESTNYSIQVDVLTTKPTSPMGVLLTSNSNGTYFTRNIEHTNRNMEGFVDFEKVQGIQGIVIVNTVSNWEEVENTYLGTKKVQSKISFDDGRTWQSIKAGKNDLHLHSVTHMNNVGRVFSSPAPGIVMGVGNTGTHLKQYDECDLYVSDDALLTWVKALDQAHKYEFGDSGAVLTAVYDEDFTSELSYSIDHGKTWKAVDLGTEIKPRILTTTPDSTSLKFLLVGTTRGGSNAEHAVFSIDFDGLHERKCTEKDFEKWYARLNEDGEPDCLMGHKQWYRRRKADADCFIDEEFKDPEVQTEICTCSDEDFECDYNFKPGNNGTTCLPVGKMIVPDGNCKTMEDTFFGSSGYRLIPGDDCNRKGGVEKDGEIEWKCSDAVQTPNNGEITSKVTSFRASKFTEYYYLERTETSSGDDETIIMRTNEQEIYLTHDHGKTWEEILFGEGVVAIYPHQYFNDVVYFVTATETVWYSTNRGDNLRTFDAPDPPNQDRLPIMSFHPNHKDWIIWTGARDCIGFFNDDCHAVAHISRDRGDDWQTLLRYVRKCQFIIEDSRGGSEKLMYCEQFANEDTTAPLQLIASDNWFEDQEVRFKDILDFATMAEFIIVAAKDSDQKSLKVDASVDGVTFADALFPANFKVPHQQAYTVLDSSTHSVFLHVTVNNMEGFEYGSIIKSNSNGTSYVMSLNGVNRNVAGFVDFEKMEGLEGVAIVNIVDNTADADKGLAKKLKTVITHNDGAEWSFIQPPAKDADGKNFDCSGDLQKCSLHLHGYTERRDPRDTFSSPSAIGVMIGVGNVGEYLGRYKEGDTFITRDGGVTWVSVKKGTYMWEYGDQGSIIVIVEESTPTSVVFYSLDEGETWTEYEFSESKMQIDDISTVPSDNSNNFLLWGKDPNKMTGDIVTINLDFSGLRDRQCVLDEENPESEGSDYYLWSPKHPTQEDDCLFGHVAQYHRKKTDANCFNGKKIQHLHNIARNCTCTRQDFECDYNYERATDGSCQLVAGLQPADHSQICRDDPGALEYFEPTGYRRIPLTTCQGGRELEYTGTTHACPGREDEYEKKHSRISGVGLFFAIVLPITAAAGVGYWVWRNWDGKFGRIRLGDGGDAFDSSQPWIAYPVAALSAVVAVLGAIPLLLTSLWRSVAGRFGGAGGFASRRYTTRSSFARGRGDYAVVDPDEGELLGEESDEEV